MSHILTARAVLKLSQHDQWSQAKESLAASRWPRQAHSGAKAPVKFCVKQGWKQPVGWDCWDLELLSLLSCVSTQAYFFFSVNIAWALPYLSRFWRSVLKELSLAVLQSKHSPSHLPLALQHESGLTGPLNGDFIHLTAPLTKATMLA